MPHWIKCPECGREEVVYRAAASETGWRFSSHKYPDNAPLRCPMSNMPAPAPSGTEPSIKIPAKIESRLQELDNLSLNTAFLAQIARIMENFPRLSLGEKQLLVDTLKGVPKKFS